MLSKPPRGSAGSAHPHSTSVSGFSHDCVCARTVCVCVLLMLVSVVCGCVAAGVCTLELTVG